MFRDVEIFQGLPEEDIGFLTERATTRTYPKGAIIINEGDEGNSLFLIQSGSIKAYLSDDQGREIVLSAAGPGGYFGELALLDEAPRSASVAAVETCKVMVISRAQLSEAIAARPRIATTLLKGLAARARALTENVRTLALLDVFGRLVKTLYSLAEHTEGGLVIDRNLTQQDLANRIRASREMVSRIMNDLAKGGYIAVERKRVSILKKIPSSW